MITVVYKLYFDNDAIESIERLQEEIPVENSSNCWKVSSDKAGDNQQVSLSNKETSTTSRKTYTQASGNGENPKGL